MNATTQPNEMLITAMLLGVLVLALIPTIFMWVSLAKQGDERKKMILEKTCVNTLVLHTATLLIDVVGSTFNAPFFTARSSNLIHLAILGILFTINFFIIKRKYSE